MTSSDTVKRKRDHERAKIGACDGSNTVLSRTLNVTVQLENDETCGLGRTAISYCGTSE